MSGIYSLVQSSGPGQINDVVSDIRALVDDDGAVDAAIKTELATYNKRQCVTTKVGGRYVVITEHSAMGGDKFCDALSGQTFTFNHVTLAASDVGKYDVPEAETVSRLQDNLERYVGEHYPSSSTPALSITPKDSTFQICIVGNKYNTQNFWTGRWRSMYTYERSSSKLSGQILVDVHYYEDGNVRLLTTKEVDVSVSGGPDTVARAIETTEKAYQDELNRAFGVLGEGSFKDLRRALPVTRSKINWNSVSAMRIGQEVQGGREKK